MPADMLNIPSYTRWFVRLAGLSGAAAVGLGAYGAHGILYNNYYFIKINFKSSNKDLKNMH